MTQLTRTGANRVYLEAIPFSEWEQIQRDSQVIVPDHLQPGSPLMVGRVLQDVETTDHLHAGRIFRKDAVMESQLRKGTIVLFPTPIAAPVGEQPAPRPGEYVCRAVDILAVIETEVGDVQY